MTAKNISFDPLIAASMGVIPSSTFLKNIFGNYNTVINDNPVASTIASNVNTFMEKQKSHMIKKVAIKKIQEYQLMV
jgi:hypothetical protein